MVSDGSGWELEDRSQNGTFLIASDGAATKVSNARPHRLIAGDVFTLGAPPEEGGRLVFWGHAQPSVVPHAHGDARTRVTADASGGVSCVLAGGTVRPVPVVQEAAQGAVAGTGATLLGPGSVGVVDAMPSEERPRPPALLSDTDVPQAALPTALGAAAAREEAEADGGDDGDGSSVDSEEDEALRSFFAASQADLDDGYEALPVAGPSADECKGTVMATTSHVPEGGGARRHGDTDGPQLPTACHASVGGAVSEDSEVVRSARPTPEIEAGPSHPRHPLQPVGMAAAAAEEEETTERGDGGAGATRQEACATFAVPARPAGSHALSLSRESISREASSHDEQRAARPREGSSTNELTTNELTTAAAAAPRSRALLGATTPPPGFAPRPRHAQQVSCSARARAALDRRSEAVGATGRGGGVSLLCYAAP